MPLLLSKKVDPYSAYAVWNISETVEQLLLLTEEDVPNKSINKKSEWIVTRILVRYLCDLFDISYNGVGSLATGKPVLIDLDADVSISHSFPIAVALINLRKPCGVDIERTRSKLKDVQNKFLHLDEVQHKDQLEKLCQIWSAKEVMFKVHGEKNLSFRDELLVKLDSSDTATGLILKNGFEKEVSLRFEKVSDYTLAYNI